MEEAKLPGVSPVWQPEVKAFHTNNLNKVQTEYSIHFSLWKNLLITHC